VRIIFTNWYESPTAWVVAPMAVWIGAYLLFAIGTMIRRRRMYGPWSLIRELGTGWRIAFALSLVWLVGSSVWLAVTQRG